MDDRGPWLAVITHQAVQGAEAVSECDYFYSPIGQDLQHLLLDVREDLLVQGCQCLQILPFLTTLSLLHDQSCKIVDGKEVPFTMWIGFGHSYCRYSDHLDLRECSLLAFVCLAMVLP